MSAAERFSATYREKLCKAEDAVADLPNDSLVVFGTGLSEPQQLLWALSNRLRDQELGETEQDTEGQG